MAKKKREKASLNRIMNNIEEFRKSKTKMCALGKKGRFQRDRRERCIEHDDHTVLKVLLSLVAHKKIFNPCQDTLEVTIV